MGHRAIGAGGYDDGEASALGAGVAHKALNFPGDLALWTEFHETIDQLPQRLREVFDLLYYHGMTQEEAAAVLGVSDRTVRERWRDAKVELTDLLGDSLPGL